MSHFTVLVPATDEKHLESVLLPYHEYECTGIDAYLEFVPEDMNELRDKYDQYEKDSTTYNLPGDFEKWIPEWCGAKQNDEGVWGRVTNQNAKWDWWSIGGRWSGLFKLKPEFAKLDKNDPVNVTLSERVDWNSMRQDQIDNATKKWQDWHMLPPKPAGKFDRDDPAWQAWRKAMDDKDLLFYVDDEKMEHDLDTLPLDEYAAKYGTAKALTFAYIDLNGQWHERAKMGWFAITRNPNDSYDTDWWTFVTSLPTNTRIYLIDCHI